MDSLARRVLTRSIPRRVSSLERASADSRGAALIGCASQPGESRNQIEFVDSKRSEMHHSIYHMNAFQAVVIGLIQGISELFPISSLGHTVLIPSWIGGTWATLVRQESEAESPYLAFVVGLHLATAIVLVGFY